MTQTETTQSHEPGSRRELLQVAMPLIISSGSLSLMHVVDRMFLTWYSQDALAAALPAGLLYWTLISLPFGMAAYVNTFVAQYEGAERNDRVAASIWQGIYLAVIAGSVMLWAIPFSKLMFGWIGHAPRVQALEIDYFSILSLGSIPVICSAALSSFFSGRSQTAVVMRVNLTATAVNAGLDYCLIFGVGPFPRWGIQGAATATVIASIITAGLYIVAMHRGPLSRRYAIWANRGFDRELFGRFVRYGLPNGVQFLVDVAAFSLFIMIVGRLGTESLAATNLAFNLNTLAFVPMMGMGTAVMTLVGKRIGEGRPELAVRTTWTAFRLAGSYMLIFAAIYVIAPSSILAPYAAYTDPETFSAMSKQVVILLRFIAVFSVFDAMVIVFGSAIRGAGDTRFSLLMLGLSSWLIMVLPTFVVWRWFGGNLIASWTACTLHISILGLCYLARFQAGHWESMRVIEYSAADRTSAEVENGSSTTLARTRSQKSSPRTSAEVENGSSTVADEDVSESIDGTAGGTIGAADDVITGSIAGSIAKSIAGAENPA